MKKTYFQLVLALVLFTVLAAGYALWYHALSAKRARVALLTSEVAAQNATEARAFEASSALLELGADEAKVHSYFVDPDDVVSFLESLQGLGKSVGASVNVVSVTDKASPRAHLDLALTITGSFNAVMSAVGAIEYAPYDVSVNTLTLSTVGDTEAAAQGPWTAALSLSVGALASSTPATPSP